jgi:predicted O-methyltransferase YrrM
MEESPTSTGSGNDFVGYEALVTFMSDRALQALDGDIVEIGAFMGGGTAKLAAFAHEHGKRVYAIDVFDPGRDMTQDTSGAKMCDIYQAFLQGRSQHEAYLEATQGFDNIVTINKDSGEVRFPPEQRFIFGFIDGNHQPEYVRNDFDLVWRNLVPGGVLGFHDYGFDLPDVTRTIDELIGEHAQEIADTFEMKDRYVILLTKKPEAGV